VGRNDVLTSAKTGSRRIFVRGTTNACPRRGWARDREVVATGLLGVGGAALSTLAAADHRVAPEVAQLLIGRGGRRGSSVQWCSLPRTSRTFRDVSMTWRTFPDGQPFVAGDPEESFAPWLRSKNFRCRHLAGLVVHSNGTRFTPRWAGKRAHRRRGDPLRRGPDESCSVLGTTSAIRIMAVVT